MKILGIITTLTALASMAGAQSMNIDFDGSATGAGTPSNFGFIGGTGQDGVWNSILAGTTNSPLLNLAGGATGASITNNGFAYSSNAQNYTGDDLLLMGDVLDGATSISFAGLNNGLYDVAVYAQAPDDPTFITSVTIGGTGIAVGGLWGGTYSFGNTHSLHSSVNVVGGALNISIGVISGFSSVNGIQITAVPEPGTLAAFAVGGLTLLALRRRRK